MVVLTAVKIRILYSNSTLRCQIHTTGLQTGILPRQLQQRIMAESLVYKPRMDLSNKMLFRLSLYHIYVCPEAWKVASLLNELHKLKPEIATQEVTSTYLHLHDSEHPMWAKAKDMARTESDELKRILRDEIGCERKKWDVRVVQPVIVMARLRMTKN